MSTSQDEVQYDQRRLLRLAMRHWPLLAVCVLLGLALGATRLVVGGVPYSATSEVIAGQPITIASLTSTTSQTTSQVRNVDAQLRTLQSDTVASIVDEKLPAGHAPYDVSFRSGTDTDAMTITVTSTDGTVARDAANEFAGAYVAVVTRGNQDVIDATEKQLNANIASIGEQLSKLQAQLAAATEDSLPSVREIVQPQQNSLLDQRNALSKQLDQVALAKAVGASGNARVIQEATSASQTLMSIVSPLVLGGVLGLLLGLALVVWRELRSGSTQETDDVLASGLDPRSVLSVDLRLPSGRGGAVGAPSELEVTSLRQVAATIWPSGHSRSVNSATLLAPVDRDPLVAAAVAARLGEQLAELHRNVVVLEIDPVNDELQRYFPQASGRGLAEVLRRECHLEEALVARSQGRLWALGAGRGLTSAELSSPEFTELLTELTQRCDHVLVVGAPLLDAAESVIVSPLVDDVVVLVRAGATKRSQLRRLISRVTDPAPADSALARPSVLLVGPGHSPRRAARAARGSPKAAVEAPSRRQLGGAPPAAPKTPGAAGKNPALGWLD